MAWNQPGGGNKGSGKDQNPNPWGKDREPGPPDLDKLFKKLVEKIKEIFGNSGGGRMGSKPKTNFYSTDKFKNNSETNDNAPNLGGDNNSGSNSGFSGMRGNTATSNKHEHSSSGNYRNNSLGSLGNIFGGGNQEIRFIATVILVALAILYIISGIYIVDPPERAVITRFGKYVRTEGPGPHFIPRLIESREIVNVDQVATSDHSGLMLTKDRNIASVGVAVQYRVGDGIDDVSAYLFNVVNPIHSLKQSTESALRQVVGQYTMDEVLTLKRAEIALAIKEQVIKTLKPYNTGILVLDVAMQFAKAPDEVRDAFDDVIKAAADEERLVNQARAYENEVLPRARGSVERLKNDALAYKQEMILKAEGNVQRFNLILPEYQKAPKVTQTRLYLDTMEQILGRVTKVVADQNGNNFIYVPMERLSGGGGIGNSASGAGIGTALGSGGIPGQSYAMQGLQHHSAQSNVPGSGSSSHYSSGSSANISPGSPGFGPDYDAGYASSQSGNSVNQYSAHQSSLSQKESMPANASSGNTNPRGTQSGSSSSRYREKNL